MEQGEIILYQPNDSLRLEVRLDGDNVWLNRSQLAELFDRDVKTIGKHINNALKANYNMFKDQNYVVQNDEILIVDEALSVGDRAFRDKCIKKIKAIMQGDITMLFVTHAVETARAFCKRGVVMKAGRIVFDGDIDAAIEYYNTKY